VQKKWQDRDILPEIRDWLHDIGITDWRTGQVAISCLQPHGFIEMHKDITDGPFLHLNLSKDSSVKISQGGTMGLGLNFIRNSLYTHAAVNCSNENRYVITVGLPYDSDEWLRQHIIKKIYYS
jgi:hypothetical protein